MNGIAGDPYKTLTLALTGAPTLTVGAMVALCVLKLAATVTSYSSGGAGGIFAPALFMGGMLGGAVGYIDVAVFHHPADSIGAFAVVGMGAVFAGVVRAPMTSILIIFEMTGGYGLVLPLMIANMSAFALARHWRHTPVYDALLEQDGIFLHHKPRPQDPVGPRETLRGSNARRRQRLNSSVAKIPENPISSRASFRRGEVPPRFAPPGLPLKPQPFGPDFEKPPGRGLEPPGPPGLKGLLDGRAPPALGLPLLVVKGRAMPPSPRGGPEPPVTLLTAAPGTAGTPRTRSIEARLFKSRFLKTRPRRPAAFQIRAPSESSLLESLACQRGACRRRACPSAAGQTVGLPAPGPRWEAC